MRNRSRSEDDAWRENQAFGRLMGTPANVEALTALAERRQPDFIAIDEEFPFGRADLAPDR